MDMHITFPGGKKVNAEFGHFVIPTDQHPLGGGDGSAPEPFATFLASIGTCAGIYVLGFCQARGLSTDGLSLVQHNEFEGRKLSRVWIEITVPDTFPEKYLGALRAAANNCAVKKALADPPELEVTSRFAKAA